MLFNTAIPFFLFVAVGAVIADERMLMPNSIDPLSDEAIEFINRLGTTWTAGRNFDSKTPISQIRKLMGVRRSPLVAKLPVRIHQNVSDEIIPATFDAREAWKQCPSIGEIRDQGSCGSCWVFGAVEAISDRICIVSNGTKQVSISAEDVLTCCSDVCGNGCGGGDPAAAWLYYRYVGIVSGGQYGSKQGCLPYQVPPCEHHTTGARPPCNDSESTPACVMQCESGYNRTFDDDKHFASWVYFISPNEIDIQAIQYEIMTNGPIEADFTVFADFLQYQSGVYQQHSQQELGKHAIRVLGWGTENGVDYWLCANSWNTDWGKLGGFFKIRRGSDECEIEEYMMAGEPK